MKKFIALTLALVMSLSLVACGGSKSTETSKEETKAEGTGTTEATKDPIPLVISHAYSDTVNKGIVANWTVDRLDELSDGGFDVTMYANSALVTSDKELAMLQQGAIECTATNGGMLEAYIPEYAIYALPFLCSGDDIGDDKMHRALHANDEWNQILDELAAEQGFKIFEVPINFGNYMLANNVRPVEKASDAKGLKVRMLGGIGYETFIEALGANPVTVAASEVSVGLEQGVFDALLSIATHTYISNWKVKYLSAPAWSIISDCMVFDKDWYDALPEDMKAALDQTMEESFEYAVELCSTKDKESVQAMADDWGTVVSTWDMTTPENMAFVEQCRETGIARYLEVCGNSEAAQRLVEIALEVRAEQGLF